MARRTSQSQNEKNKAGTFFLATLILWFVSVLFEIIFNKRSELLWIVAGAFFFQIANWVVRSFISRDPLFVNTSVSLLHSTIISVSGSQYFFYSALSLSLSLFSFGFLTSYWKLFLIIMERIAWFLCLLCVFLYKCSYWEATV